MNKLPISIVIPTMNRPKSLLETLNFICKFNGIPEQIIIVDQSKDLDQALKCEKQIKEIYKNIKINYIYQKKASLTKARNLGLKYVENDIVIFMDDDVEINNDTIKNVFDIFSDKSIAMLAGIDELQEESKSLFGYLFGIKSIKNMNKGQVSKSIFGKFPSKINELEGQVDTEWAMGFFFVVRKSLLNKWDIKWDEKLISYAYAEDLDFSYSYYKQAKKENLKCVIDSRVKVKHNCSREWRVSSKKSTIMFIINREYLSYKHFNNISSRIRTRWANVGVLIERIIKRNNPIEFLKGMYYCDKYHSDIKKGVLHYELYD